MKTKFLVQVGVALAMMAAFLWFEYYNVFGFRWNGYEISGTALGWICLLMNFFYSVSLNDESKTDIFDRIIFGALISATGICVVVAYLVYVVVALVVIFLVYKLIILLNVTFDINIFVVIGLVVAGIVLIATIALLVLVLKSTTTDRKIRVDKPIDPTKIPPPPPVLSD